MKTLILLIATLSFAELADAQYITPACQALNLQYSQQWNEILNTDRLEIGAAYNAAYETCPRGTSSDCGNWAVSLIQQTYETVHQRDINFLNGRDAPYTAAGCGTLPRY